MPKTFKEELEGIRERQSVYKKLKDRITSTFKQFASEAVTPAARRATMRQTIKKRKEVRKESINRRQSGSIKIPKNSQISAKQVFSSPGFRRF
mmetsp:Transcript_11733/g.17963  ORF Transcript_11733/g.17963 Transcript_11733/m.17963 type:complete len:93 (-) Transcript_11733:1473-1751(-)